MSKKPSDNRQYGSIGADIIRRMIAQYEQKQTEDSFSVKLPPLEKK